VCVGGGDELRWEQFDENVHRWEEISEPETPMF